MWLYTVSVGSFLLVVKRPWTMGYPSVARIFAWPPKSRISCAAASAQRRMSLARSGSAEIDGISTSCWSVFSKRSRSDLAHATSDFLSVFMRRECYHPTAELIEDCGLRTED